MSRTKRKVAARKIVERNAVIPADEFLGDVTVHDENSENRTGIPATERAKMRRTIEEMLAHNFHTADIAEAMAAPPFNLTPAQTKTQIARIRRHWREIDVDRRPDYKNAAMRRLLNSIMAARKKGDFGAVATLERLLADIQGTKEPLKLQLNVSSVLEHSVAEAVARMSNERIQALARAHHDRRAALGLGRTGRIPKRLQSPQTITVEAE